MWNRYRSYLQTPPAQVFEWRDPPTGARAWLVVNSLRGGAAGGGTRMQAGLTRDEVVHLAKTMELKFAFSGPPIGGAKSGIAFDPSDPRRDQVLRRWLRAVRPFLARCYGTAGDLNVDAERDLAPACRSLGLRHPQEGVIRGYLDPTGEELDRICDAIRAGTSAALEGGRYGVRGRRLAVSELVTGWGVARSAAHLYRLRGERLEGRRVVVEGFGNVGGSAALHLAREGARVVTILDAESALVAPDGLDADAVEELMVRRRGGRLPDHPDRVIGEEREAAYGRPADLFVPAAVSGSVDVPRLEQLERAGVETIVCAANQPFRESTLGDTRVQEEADRRFQVVVDAIGSMGMARAFHLLMTEGSAAGPDRVFEGVDEAVGTAVETVVDRAGGEWRGLLAAGLGVALDRVSASGRRAGEPTLTSEGSPG